MDRTHLVFLKVAETGNLTAASRELNIAQPSLTRTINKMEEGFGVALFTRLPRGMELTPAGEALHRHLLEMKAIYQRACEDVDAVRKGYVETVRIGAGLTYQILLMPTVLNRLWQRFPQTSFQVTTGSAQAHTQALLDGELDAAVTAAVEGYRNPSLDVTLLGTIDHGVANWPGTLPDVPAGEVLPLSQLRGHSWVLFMMEPEMNLSLNQRFFRLGLPTPRVALTTSSLQLGLQVVRDEGYVMSVPVILRERLAAQGFRVHHTDEPVWRTDSGIACHRSNRHHPVLSALVDDVQALVGEMAEFEGFGMITPQPT